MSNPPDPQIHDPSYSDPWAKLKPGDRVTRMLGGTVPMPVTVTYVNEHFIFCGPWNFSKITGCEVDYSLGWNGTPEHTGSFLKLST